MSCSKSPFSAPGEVDNIFVWALILTNTMTLSSPSVPSRMHKGLRVVLASGFGGRNWFFSKTIGFFAIYAVKCETAYQSNARLHIGLSVRTVLASSSEASRRILSLLLQQTVPLLFWMFDFDLTLTPFWPRFDLETGSKSSIWASRSRSTWPHHTEQFWHP